jgi:hypothetical protein
MLERSEASQVGGILLLLPFVIGIIGSISPLLPTFHFSLTFSAFIRRFYTLIIEFGLLLVKTTRS